VQAGPRESELRSTQTRANAHRFGKSTRSESVERDRSYWVFVAPAALAVLVFIAVPLVYGVSLSLRNFDLSLGTDSPAGLSNYARAVADPGFQMALLRIFVYVAFVVALDFAIGFAEALLLHSLTPRVATFFRGLFLLPILIIPAASATFWRLMMYGVPNVELYRALGIYGLLPPPLGDQTLAFWAIILTVVWAWSPWVFLLLMGGLEGLDASVLEAADVDGASYLQKVRYVIVPMMKPVIFVTLALKAVDSFLTFDFVWIMTTGGPGNATQVSSTYIYLFALKNLNYGYGAAMSMIMLVISAALSVVAVVYWQRSQTGELA
jgi:ABC-type sugar transport system permease subunit